MTYTEKELDQLLHGISLSLLSKKSAQHWRYDEETAKEIEWLEALERKVRADKADRKTENNSEKPNNCETCKYHDKYGCEYPCDECEGCDKWEQTEPTISKMEQVDKDINVRSKDEPQTCEDLQDWKDRMWAEAIVTEPQTDTEIAKAIVHKMIDDAVIAEDAYPDLRQKMHDAVDEYEPRTDEPPMDEYYKDHDEFYDCDRYVITNDEGERAYNCIGCQTDCAWR